MGVAGINHITLSVDDVEASVRFYRDLLGCNLVARWPTGAYLAVGPTWLALHEESSPHERGVDYSHVAFDVSQSNFADMCDAIRAAGCQLWQENWTEGDSLYFCDPNGHRLEIHSSTFAHRIETAVASPWPGLVVEPNARALTATAPTVRDPRKPRTLACLPVGVVVLLYDDANRTLLLRRPLAVAWEAVSGSVLVGEGLEDAARREVVEELGDFVRHGPFTTVRATEVDYDPDLPPLIGVVYAARYRGGEIRPSDDMRDAEAAWVSVTDVGVTHTVTVPTRHELFGLGAVVLRATELADKSI